MSQYAASKSSVSLHGRSCSDFGLNPTLRLKLLDFSGLSARLPLVITEIWPLGCVYVPLAGTPSATQRSRTAAGITPLTASHGSATGASKRDLEPYSSP